MSNRPRRRRPSGPAGQAAARPSPDKIRSYSSAGGTEEETSTEGMTFRIDGVLFTCHGRVSAFDLAEFAGRAEDAGPEINDPGVIRILSDFMHGLLGDPTYAEVTRHRRVHRTPDAVMQQIIFDLIEDAADRPSPRPSPSPAGRPEATSSPGASRSPATAAAASQGTDLARLADSAWDRLAAEGDITLADLTDDPAPEPPPAGPVTRRVSFGHPERLVIEAASN